MKAMLYADWMNLRRSMKALLVVVVVMVLASVTTGNGLSFLLAMLCMLSLMVPATLMSSDHAYGWDKLSLSLPISRRDVVSSKFAISLLVNLTVVVLSMICIAGMNAFAGDAMAEDMMGMLACEAVGLALMGIEFVLVLRFGPERGRYFLIGVVWVPIILLTVVKKHPAFNGLVQAVGGMDSWPVGQLAAFFGGLVMVGAIVYAVCWRIGVGIYRKKEL